MGGRTRRWLVIAGLLVLTGGILIGSVLAKQQWDVTSLSATKYETEEYRIGDAYQNIAVVTDTADVTFMAAQGDETVVTCYEENHTKHLVAVKDGTLTITAQNTKKWYDYIGMNFDTPKITVCMPQEAYSSLAVQSGTGNVEIPGQFRFESIAVSASTGHVTNYASASGNIAIKTSTGKIRVENISANEMELSASTGKVEAFGVTCGGDVNIQGTTGKAVLTDLTCKNLTTKANTGDVSMQNVVVAETISIQRTTGDVAFDGCDGGALIVTTDTGDVEGSLLTDKVFITQTDTGRVVVPQTVSGGNCQIKTDTGDIEITIKN